jgi:hypothetical protein
MGRRIIREEIIEIFEGSQSLKVAYDRKSGRILISQQAKEEVRRIARESRDGEELEQRLIGWARNESEKVLRNGSAS